MVRSDERKSTNSFNLIHVDLKPENVLIKDEKSCEVRLIDFGSSCFLHDHLSSYVQSRAYRAPEVILGLRYGPTVDIWSLGCVLYELYCGQVLFSNHNVPVVLARIGGIIGPFDTYMMRKGKNVEKYFAKERVMHPDPDLEPHSQQQPASPDASGSGSPGRGSVSALDSGGSQSQAQAQRDRGYRWLLYEREEDGSLSYLFPRRTSLARLLTTHAQRKVAYRVQSGQQAPLHDNTYDPASEEFKLFVDFLSSLLTIRPEHRPCASDALKHPWITYKRAK